jgi:energy-coupling factor transport system permease protein
MISGRGSLGRFVAGESFWHGIDPRAKVGLAVAAAVALARPDGPVALSLACLVILVAGIAGGLSPRNMVSPLLSLGWLLAATAAANVLMVPGEPLWPGIPGSREGAVRGIETAARLAGMLLAVQIMVVSTPALVLARGMEALASPLPLVRKAAAGFPMVFSLTLRFVPLLIAEWGKLRESASARGFLGRGVNPAGRVVREAGLLVPLFVVSFRKAEDLALSMHLRGYRGGAPRSALHPLSFRGRDCLVTLAAVAGGVASWTL